MMMHGIPSACACLYLLSLYASFSSAADSERDDFRQIYGQYQKYIQQEDWSNALAAAEKALQRGLQVFDEKSENVANLRLNYAKLLIRFEKFDPAAQQLESALAAKEKAPGKSPEQLIEILLQLGVASHHSKRASVSAKHLKRAAKLAAGTSNASYEASVNFAAGLSLVNLGSSRRAKPFLERAQEIYHKMLGETDPRGAITSLHLGNIQLTEKDHKAARRSLELAVLGLTSPSAAHRQFALASRRLLVQVLERLDLGDEATVHCVDFAKIKANGGSARPELLHRGPFPGTQLFDEFTSGDVMIEFTVDEAGYVSNPQIVFSSAKELNRTMLKWAQTQRWSGKIGHLDKWLICA